MVLHPDIAKKAQAELDQVLVKERLPKLEDRPMLPYLNAVVLEVLRWHAIVPAGMFTLPSSFGLSKSNVGHVGLPHLCNADDNHKGYFISKGTMVVANIWYTLRSCSRILISDYTLITGECSMTPRCTLNPSSSCQRDSLGRTLNPTLAIAVLALGAGTLLPQSLLDDD